MGLPSYRALCLAGSLVLQFKDCKHTQKICCKLVELIVDENQNQSIRESALDTIVKLEKALVVEKMKEHLKKDKNIRVRLLAAKAFKIFEETWGNEEYCDSVEEEDRKIVETLNSRKRFSFNGKLDGIDLSKIRSRAIT